MQLPSLLFSLFNKQLCEVWMTPGFVTWLIISIVLLCPGNTKKLMEGGKGREGGSTKSRIVGCWKNL